MEEQRETRQLIWCRSLSPYLKVDSKVRDFFCFITIQEIDFMLIETFILENSKAGLDKVKKKIPS